MKRSRIALVLTLWVWTSGCSKPVVNQAASPSEPPKDSALSAGPPPQKDIELVADPPPVVEAPPPVAAPKPPSREALLRTELKTWKGVPFKDDGTSHKGIGNAAFVRAAYLSTFGVEIPPKRDDQMKTGKLMTREELAPGDLVFFEGGGIGPLRSKSVGLYIGHDQVALAEKDSGVTLVHLSEERWSKMFKTARRVPSDPNATAPTFDAADYGSDRAALFRDIAVAWKGTLYKDNGTTFDGIGNDEFVREVYEAVYETELEGNPKNWETMGEAVKRTALQPGDIVIYEAGGVGKVLGLRHAGLYIGRGDFVHALKGSAVTISKLSEPRWKDVRTFRRIDPDVVNRLAEARAARTRPATPIASTSPSRGSSAPGSSAPVRAANKAPAPAVEPVSNRTPAAASGATPVALTDRERRLRDTVESWRGTPYKIGGTSRSGIDCSAFTRVVFDTTFDFELPRTAEEQERLGAPVDRKALETGDLVFFRTQGFGPLFKSRHVGVYLGNGEFAQSSGKQGVTVTRLDNRYRAQKYSSARRVPAALQAN